MVEIPLGHGSQTDYLEQVQKPAPVVPSKPAPKPAPVK